MKLYDVYYHSIDYTYYIYLGKNSENQHSGLVLHSYNKHDRAGKIIIFYDHSPFLLYSTKFNEKYNEKK